MQTGLQTGVVLLSRAHDALIRPLLCEDLQVPQGFIEVKVQPYSRPNSRAASSSGPAPENHRCTPSATVCHRTVTDHHARHPHRSTEQGDAVSHHHHHTAPRSRGTRCPTTTTHTAVPPPPPTPLHGAGGRGVPPPPPTPSRGTRCPTTTTHTAPRSRGTRCPTTTTPTPLHGAGGRGVPPPPPTPLHGAGGRGVPPPPPPTPLHGAGGRGVPPPPPTPLHGAGGRGAHLHAVLLPRQRAQVAAVTQPAERREMTAKLPNTKHIVANSRSPEYSLNRIFIGAHNRRNTSTLTHVSYANPHAKHTRTNPEAQQPSPHVLPANHQPAHSMNQHAGY